VLRNRSDSGSAFVASVYADPVRIPAPVTQVAESDGAGSLWPKSPRSADDDTHSTADSSSGVLFPILAARSASRFTVTKITAFYSAAVLS